MKIATRRRLAVGVLATTSALLAGLLIAPAASAANIVDIDPNFAINNDPSEVLTLTTQSSFTPDSRVELTRPNTTDTLTANTTGTSVLTQSRAEFNFADTGSGANDGPANPGVYNATITDPKSGASDSCQSCFTVISSQALTVSSTTPNAVAQGGEANITVAGTGFARGTRLEVLLDGAVDPNVTIAAPTTTGTAEQCAARQEAPGCTIEVAERTTATEMLRRFQVKTAAVTGPRGLRVTNTDGSTATCTDCFTVNGAALTGVDPNVASNSPSATPTVTLTFTGPAVPKSGTPSLVYVAESPGSASRSDLTIVGTNVSYGPNSVTADYDVRNAAPGSKAYQPTLTQDDGSLNACDCRFSIAQPQPATVASLDPDTISQSDSRTVTIKGTHFSEGIEFAVSGSGVTVASVDVVSDTGATVNLQTTAAAAPGKRDVTPVTTDGRSGPVCSGCLTVTASGSPSPSAPADGLRSNARYAGLSSPVRALDTRDDRGSPRTGEIVLDLSTRITDPNATAAVLNVTVTNPSARGFVVVYPKGNTKPGTSNVNFDPAQTQANEVVVGLPVDKRVSLFVDSAKAHVIVDLVGFFTTTDAADTGRVTTSAPVRELDTREKTVKRRTGEVVVDLSDRLPEGSTDAILNVTVTGPSARGFVVVYPTGTERPETSNVNFELGQTQANEVVTRVGTGSKAGQVSLFVDSASAALIVDVVGAVTPGSASGTQVFTPLQQPTRALNTRDDNGSRRNGDVQVTMPSTVPSNATGVILNVTATNGTRPGFVTVYPTGSTRPDTSNVNFRAERQATATQPASAGTQANEVTSALGSNRQVTLFVGGSGTPTAHLIVDVVGYLTTDGATAAPSPSPSCSPSLLQTCPSPSPTASPTASATASPS
ncbi:MAG: hypothetical protein WD794_00305 [Mycobacteriales bacterium]